MGEKTAGRPVGAAYWALDAAAARAHSPVMNGLFLHIGICREIIS
jgi:hypothetical protein